MKSLGIILISAALLGACSKSEGTEPHDMTVAQHEVAAGGERTAAEQHGAQYDPNANRPATTCNRSVCWSSDVNPTQQHSSDMATHRELADKHRAAAQALRDAEANACAGIAEEDRDVSPFYHREDITSVSQVNGSVQRGNTKAGQLEGGRAVFRAVPGLTAEWLQREVNCHLARAAAVGYDPAQMPYCPLQLKGVVAKVSSVGDGFAVEVTSDDATTAQEIWRRMQTLHPAS